MVLELCVNTVVATKAHYTNGAGFEGLTHHKATPTVSNRPLETTQG